MVDFVIKPTTGNLKIQDDQDVDRIVIAPTTGVTTLSNPTLTAPTIANMANCTFPAGHVVQVVEGTHATEQTTTSTSFVDTTIDVSITPSSTSSKVLVIASTHTHLNGGAAQVGYYTIYRDSTNLGSGAGFASIWHGYPNNANNDDALATHVCFQKLDSPNTTSAVEYAIYCKTNNSSYTCYWSMNASTSVITAIEIAG